MITCRIFFFFKIPYSPCRFVPSCSEENAKYTWRIVIYRGWVLTTPPFSKKKKKKSFTVVGTGILQDIYYHKFIWALSSYLANASEKVQASFWVKLKMSIEKWYCLEGFLQLKAELKAFIYTVSLAISSSVDRPSSLPVPYFKPQERGSFRRS